MDSLPIPRPNPPARKDTYGILSYYQSDEAGQGYAPPLAPDIAEEAEPMTINTRVTPRRQLSTASSPSEYSPDTDETVERQALQAPPIKSKSSSSQVRRRPSIPSEGGSDRRRLAIMDMSSGSQSTSDQTQSGATRKRKSSVRLRRGIEGQMDGLALVAPPDAAPSTYTHLTPPSTAPIVSEKKYSESSQDQSSNTNHRSASEAASSSTDNKSLHRRKSSRNVGIVGTSPSGSSTPMVESKPQPQPDVLKPPIFQVPQSRSPSPGGRSQSSEQHGQSSKNGYPSTMSILTSQPEIVTPGIGEGKEVHDPVAAPVIVSLTPSTPHTDRHPRSQSPTNMSSARTASPGSASPSPSPSPSPSLASSYPSPPITADPYLFYQPGVHATAGPLPPPPRAAFNISPGSTPPPRPPRINSPPPTNRRRDLGANAQPLALPETILHSKASNGSMSDVRSTSSKSAVSDQSEVVLPMSRPLSPTSEMDLSNSTKPSHVREGAFPPSIESTASSPIDIGRPKDSMQDLVADVGNAIDDIGLINANDVPPPTVIEPPRSSDDSVARNDWVSLTAEDVPRVLTPTSDENALSVDGNSYMSLLRRSTSRSPPKVPKELGEEGSPSSSPRRLGTLAANLKRFSSLPRTPSRRSEKRLSAGSRSSNASSMSPLPEVPPLPRSPPPIHKIVSPWPSAMFYADVVAKKTALERSLGYAEKINELYIYDCGLSDFLEETRAKSGNPRSKRATLMPSGPRMPSTAPTSFQPRHISRSSMASEATFPRRADATAATDLAYRIKADTSVPQGPPPLPYPSLAQPTSLLSSKASTNTSASSLSSARTIASPTSGKSPGFFSSLGRKASTKNQRAGALSPPPASRLQKSPLKAPPNPRPVDIATAPTVPGGPRAVPNRVSRSQTIMLPKTSPSSASSHRSSSMTRRPSLFTARRQSPEASNTSHASNIEEGPDFAIQVAKLQDLLPQVDKDVLAGYLRRAGSDLNAIGQYLEDEKNGTVQQVV